MSGKGGFTLTEFLLAMGLFAAIGLALAGTLRSGFEAWRRTEEAGRVNQEARRVLEELGRELRAAVPLPHRPFEGEPARLAFDLLADSPEGPRLDRVVYALSREGDALLRTQEPVKHGLERAQPARLGSRPAAVSFLYPEGLAEGRVRWTDVWSGELPAAVRAVFVIRDRFGGEHRFERTLWVPLGRLP